MPWSVTLKRRADKNAVKLPKNVRALLVTLLSDLKESGPLQPQWGNYSKLGENDYHCHLNHHYVACWSHRTGTLIVEVYYVGSRESAPY